MPDKTNILAIDLRTLMELGFTAGEKMVPSYLLVAIVCIPDEMIMQGREA